MMNLSAVRDGLKARLAGISGLRTFDVLVDQVPVPCAVVGGPERIEYDTTYRDGRVTLTIPVQVYVSRSSERAGQDTMDGYLASTGPLSVKAAIEGDPTLGGAAETTQVPAMREYGTYIIGGIEYLGFEIQCDVVTLG